MYEGSPRSRMVEEVPTQAPVSQRHIKVVGGWVFSKEEWIEMQMQVLEPKRFPTKQNEDPVNKHETSTCTVLLRLAFDFY